MIKNEIVTQLANLGLEPGSSVLVHSSLSSLGHVEGGADAVIDALLDAVGPGGTVIAPTLTGTETDGPDHPPTFDPARTPCWTGVIPETLRQRPDAIRSIHPTHSVTATGAQASDLTRDHIRSITPCDDLSPYGKLAGTENGVILLLGVDHRANTTLHHVEALAGVDYHMQGALTRATLILDGRQIQRHYLLHDWGTPRAFNVIDPVLSERGIQRVGRVGSATVRLIQARPMVQTVLQMLRANPRILCRPD